MTRVVVLVVVACVGVLASAVPAAAHSACPAGQAAVHHHKPRDGKVKHYCRQRAERGRHARCRNGGHHHHRVRGRVVHYCAAKPRRRRTAGGRTPGFGLPAPAPGSSTPLPGRPGPAPGPVAPQPGPATPLPPAASRLQVVTRDTPTWRLGLSRSIIPAGPALVELVNRGQDPHDLKIGTAGHIPETLPEGIASTRVTLGAGSYTLYCSLPGHAALGMSATLTVTP